MRVYKRINDIYEVELPDCKRYFQFLQSDSSMLGGNVIAIFNNKYDKFESPSLDDIAKGAVEYYCHTNINLGVKLGLWKKYGNAPACSDLSDIYFKNYVDEELIGLKCWRVWRVNEEFMFFNELPARFKHSYSTLLFSPKSVYHKLKYGNFLGRDF
ncbi:MAG: hypothetical protein K2J62_08200 [Bacteroidales bacterium]|nr:hypothetical protein [Bacteroidales bacterium]